jgi:hypothetical protein
MKVPSSQRAGAYDTTLLYFNSGFVNCNRTCIQRLGRVDGGRMDSCTSAKIALSVDDEKPRQRQEMLFHGGHWAQAHSHAGTDGHRHAACFLISVCAVLFFFGVARRRIAALTADG